MKPLSEQQRLKIQDLVAESALGLPEYVYEKDLYVVEVLKAILATPKNAHFDVVFCGGTCLSKAYGLLERMSEDVDFKVVPTEAGALLSASALRKHLSSFAQEISEQLETHVFGQGSVERVSRDGNRYTALHARYDSVFERPDSLRAHLLVELNFTPLALPRISRSVGTLFDQIAYGESQEPPIDVDSIALLEALAEKLVSFPRRLALYVKRNPSPSFSEGSGWDQSLVRHLYDVWVMLERCPMLKADKQMLLTIVQRVIHKDARDFEHQHPEFQQNSQAVLIMSMQYAANCQVLQEQYAQFLVDMVYAAQENRPTYQDACDRFHALLIDVFAEATL